MNSNRTVLAVFAHPDDDALACLGTIARFTHADYQVYVLTLTAGERSNTAIGRTRLYEAENVAQLVGYTLLKDDLTDGHLTFNTEMVSLVEKYVKQLSPQVVITHYPQNFGYGHQDHDSTAAAVINAARRAPCVDWILYAEPPVQDWGFLPNLYVDITRYMDLKKQAIRLHESEGSKSYMLPDIATMRAQWWALQNHPDTYSNGRYLEPFVLVKGLLGLDPFMQVEHA
ncbi:PIG-L family deacetylase [Ktedonobacteria bacterium brp13]|nr:PIG-L family deacetylase [Ktedonobacteria bacterium brp13]